MGFIRVVRARLRAVMVAAAVIVGGVGLPASGAASAAAATELRLYILDCGTIAPMDPKLFSLTAGEIHSDGSFVSPCYLVVHPKGTLIWDVGQVPDAAIADDGTEASVQGILKAKRRLAPQLAALGYQPKDITYVAMSHYHADHTANANMFAGSTWIVQKAEYDVMFSDAQVGIRTPESYKDLKSSRRITLNNADHDVFGDGRVVIKTAPGHTPGHQMLFLKLAKFGPLLLAGDLYHFPEEKTLDRVPTFDFDATMTRATRKKVDEFVKQSGAKMWIQHDAATYAPLKKAPEFYN
ncbi:MAG TPA: N-acyl homoserine lactonase family protein [Steroidobacteraceae bacterium]|jgi:glyoxylase-like metal-dependent hydrolase (beta-lactamase superfamily II)|nr:N-acyl homoserine lactonase family protein [Steroidobacteraceae bacterium]